MKMYDILAKTITESWQVVGQMSPYLLFGSLVGQAEQAMADRGLGEDLCADR